ncbi:DUF2207 domain-containing protein [Falsirhodobacter algicola]|uniref:DUF2207 domain-containing protein n=1 Tax=Falsirhodobacter algicola TaxID=2692330 RepID=A0A8J8SKC1_9RHOB|nr:DUF2207 domain-containing protein [Falsirhodobacter algicola]QUS35710.1 DUF2207 domain-containing protein [Falsirhodobacter algicola]
MPFLLRMLFALCLTLLPAAPIHADERIRSFVSEITIDPTGGLRITETLDVQAEGDRIRHGIFRELPLTENGIHWGGFDLVDATMDGAPVDTRIQRRDGAIRIYLGDQDTLVTPGVHRFRLRYDVDRQVRFFADYDELYWNITGNAWEFRIDTATARIHLPEGAVATDVETFTGPVGSRAQNAVERRDDGGRTVIVTAEGALDWNEGMTTAIAFPTGIVARPTLLDRMLFALRDRPADVTALLGTLMLGAALWLIWRWKGKDAPLGHIRERSTPPEGVSPALAQYIRADGITGNAAMVAAAVDLGVKGFATIAQHDTAWSIARTGKADDGTLPVGEAAILTHLDGLKRPLMISPTNGKAVRALLEEFRTAMRKEHGARFHIPNVGWTLLGAAGSYGLAFAIIGQAFAGQPWLIFFLPMLPLGVLLFERSPRALAVTTGIALSISCLMWLIFGLRAHALDPIPAAGLIALPVMFGIFAARIGLTTSAGRTLKKEIEGFRRHLSAAQSKGRSRDGARQRFEAFLPYAIALGVEEEFAKDYELALSRATTKASSPTRIWMPAWFQGNPVDGSLGSISAACQAMTTGVNTCTSSSSGLSGGSGGGFSGGGGGGGGGGGW